MSSRSHIVVISLFLFQLSVVSVSADFPDISDFTAPDVRPYRSLYGRESVQRSPSKFAQTLADVVSGGIDFLADGGQFMDREPRDSTPKYREGVQFDFIVVGAGTAGAAIASRLSEIPQVSVLLIEAGRSESLLMDVPIIVNLLQYSNDINWKYKTEPSNSYCLGMTNHQCNWPRGKVMGGSSVLNYMIATRGNKKDYDRWAQLGNSGWSWKEVLPYFKKLETMGIEEFRDDTVYHNQRGPVHTDYVPFHTPLAEAFVQAGVELGYEELDYNGKKQTGFSYLQTTMKNGTRMSSSRAYLHHAKDRPNLFVTKRSLATKLLMDRAKKRVIGVEFLKNNRRYQVYARREVILSAGAIGSPQLLMLSGIGPADHLRQVGIKVVVDSPVGENLMDHIAYGGMVFVADQPVGVNIGDFLDPSLPYLRDFLVERKGPVTIPGGTEALGFINVDDPNDKEDFPDMELLFVCSTVATQVVARGGVGLSDEFARKSYAGLNETYTWTIFPMLLRPKSRGRILLRNRNIHSHPRIIPNYMAHPDDVRILVRGIRASLAIARTKSMRRYGSRLHSTPVPGCERFGNDSDEYWECAVRSFTMNIYHYSGTCKMGAEGDPSAVVNPRLQVIGIQGLRVADASIMPEIITGHTNIPTFMIAEKLADMVKQDWGYPTEPIS